MSQTKTRAAALESGEKEIAHILKKNSVAVVRKQAIPTERPPLVGEVFFLLICIVGGGIKVYSTLRPLNGLLCQPRVITIMEKPVE
jgi:hypothetical protein